MPVINELSGALQLASPALPIGSFSYSQGLETAVELGLVNDEQAAKEWIGAGLTEIIGRCDAPVMISTFRSCRGESEQELGCLNSWYLVTRESLELREETLQMGWSLLKLANALHWIDPQNPVNQLFPGRVSYGFRRFGSCARPFRGDSTDCLLFRVVGEPSASEYETDSFGASCRSPGSS